MRLHEARAVDRPLEDVFSFTADFAGLVQAGAGLGSIAYDIRQCSGFLYGIDLADELIASDRADTVAVVGAEVHAGFLPWSEDAWRVVLHGSGSISEEDFERNTTAGTFPILYHEAQSRAADPRLLRRFRISSPPWRRPLSGALDPYRPLSRCGVIEPEWSISR